MERNFNQRAIQRTRTNRIRLFRYELQKMIKLCNRYNLPKYNDNWSVLFLEDETSIFVY